MTPSISLLAVLLLPWITLALLPMDSLRKTIRRSLPLTPAVTLALGLSADVELNWEGLLLGSGFAIDAANRPFVAATAIGWLAAALLALPFAERTSGQTRFLTCFLLAMAGNTALVLTQDALTFYAAFAVMSLAAYGLVNHDGSRASALAGRVYIVLAMVGELLLFAGLLAIAGATSDLGYPLEFVEPVPSWAMACIVLGFGVKAGLLPLHFGLPLAYASAPHPAGVAMSGAMLSAGLLGLWHWLPLGHSAMPGWSLALAILGLSGVVLGTVCGLLQRAPKPLLGYSSISQVGLMVLFLSVGLVTPGAWAAIAPLFVLFVVHHSLAKASAFAMTDGGAPRSLPASLRVAILALPALALIGVPLTSGFAAKSGLKEVLAAAGGFPGLLLPLLSAASVGTAALLSRWLYLVIRADSTAERTQSLWIGAALIAVSFALPWMLSRQVSVADPGSLWAAAWPALAGFAIAAAAARAQAAGRLGHLPPGDIGMTVERITRRTIRCLSSAGDSLSRHWHAVPARIRQFVRTGTRVVPTVRVGRTASDMTLGLFVVVLAAVATVFVTL